LCLKPVHVNVVVHAPPPAGGAYRGGARPLETLEVSWRQMRWLGYVIFVALFLLFGAFIVTISREAPTPITLVVMTIFTLAFVAIASSVMGIRARLLISERDVVVEQQKMNGRHEARVVFADVHHFRCQVHGSSTFDICAVLPNGDVVCAVAEIADSNVAAYVKQLLEDRLRATRARV
jgi:hypothetical protein